MLRDDYNPQSIEDLNTYETIKEFELNVEELPEDLKSRLSELQNEFNNYIKDPSDENLEELMLLDTEVDDAVLNFHQSDVPDRDEDEYNNSPQGIQERILRVSQANSGTISVSDLKEILPNCPNDTVLVIGNLQLEKSFMKPVYRVYKN